MWAAGISFFFSFVFPVVIHFTYAFPVLALFIFLLILASWLLLLPLSVNLISLFPLLVYILRCFYSFHSFGANVASIYCPWTSFLLSSYCSFPCVTTFFSYFYIALYFSLSCCLHHPAICIHKRPAITPQCPYPQFEPCIPGQSHSPFNQLSLTSPMVTVNNRLPTRKKNI